ncbi:MAG: SPOR domain-containing protein [Acidobacteriota bacterium]
MSDGDGFRPGLREILWVAAGVVCLSFLVAAASWLFSPRSSSPGGSAPEGPAIQEETIQPGRFQREVVSSGGVVPQVTSSQEGLAAPAQSQTSPSLPSGAEKAAAPAPPPAETFPSTDAVPRPGQEEHPLPASISPPQSAPSPEPERGGQEATSPPKPSGFGIQVGAFSSQANARSTVGALRASGYTAEVLEREGRFKVVVTGYAKRETAEEARRSLMKKGFPNAFVVSLESP